MIGHYQELASQLHQACEALESLYHERERLLAEKQRLQDLRKQISDDLFKHLTDPDKLELIQQNLEQVDLDLNLQNAVLQSLNSHCETQEQTLHDLTPKACHTFSRLFLTLRQATFQSSLRNLSSLLSHPDLFKDVLQLLAEATIEFQDLQTIHIPAGGNWMLVRPLTNLSDLDRQQTLDFVLQTAHQLQDSAAQLFQELDKFPDLPIPDYVLGELPLQLEPSPEASQFDLNNLGLAEREFVEQLCRDAGRTLDTLTDQERLVLQASLKNFYSQPQFAQPAVQQGHTMWDGRQA